MSALLATLHARVLSRKGATMPMGEILEALKILGALLPPGGDGAGGDRLQLPAYLTQPRPDGDAAPPPGPP